MHDVGDAVRRAGAETYGMIAGERLFEEAVG